jgi:hypothetical protein
VKISNKKNSFLSTVNQYFLHIPYVTSKNLMRLTGTFKLAIHWLQEMHLLCSATIFFNKTQKKPFLVEICVGYPSDIKFQNSEYAVLFLVPKIVTKSAVRFVRPRNLINKTQGFLLFLGGICMRGNLRCQISKFWVCSFVPGPQNSNHTIRFVENLWNLPCKTQGLAFCVGGTLRT